MREPVNQVRGTSVALVPNKTKCCFFLFVLVLKQNKCHLVLHLPEQNKWEQIGINHLVLKQNKCHLVFGRQEQNK